MRKVCVVSMLLAHLLCWADHTPAQETRIAAFALNCFVPTTHGLHTRAVLVGKIKVENRTIEFSASCFDAPSASLFPELQASDGKVESIDLFVVTNLENGNQHLVAQNSCHADARNGFLAFRCTASEETGGEVEILVSIEPLHLQVTSNGVTP